MFNEIVLIDHKRPLAERAKARKSVGPYRWRPSKPNNGRGFYQSSHGLAMDRAGSSINLRLEEANDHLRGSRLSHISGYYCDPYGDGDTLQPIIARLPHGRGFLAGWTMGAGMCAALDSEIWETEEEAARAAHDMAERDAERERERHDEYSEDWDSVDVD